MANTKGLGVVQMHEPDEASVGTVLDMVAPLRPMEAMLAVSGTGADRVSAELSRTDDRLVIRLINYGAELHPDLPELEQQKADRSIPASDLVLRLRIPADMRIDASAVETYFPEQEPKVECAMAGDAVVIRVDRLEQYGVIGIAAN
jgi:hypothetical protein